MCCKPGRRHADAAARQVRGRSHRAAGLRAGERGRQEHPARRCLYRACGDTICWLRQHLHHAGSGRDQRVLQPEQRAAILDQQWCSPPSRGRHWLNRGILAMRRRETHRARPEQPVPGCRAGSSVRGRDTSLVRPQGNYARKPDDGIGQILYLQFDAYCFPLHWLDDQRLRVRV